LATAIISVALLSLTALLVQAVDKTRKAAGTTIGALIGGRIMGEYQLMDWQTFLDHQPKYRFFDEFGEEFSGPNGEQDAVFTAFSQVVTKAPEFHSGGGVETALECRQVVVIVVDLPADLAKEKIEAYQAGGGGQRNVYLHRSVVVNLDK
jgi:uncharacterized protein (TIGR02598 family)